MSQIMNQKKKLHQKIAWLFRKFDLGIEEKWDKRDGVLLFLLFLFYIFIFFYVFMMFCDGFVEIFDGILREGKRWLGGNFWEGIR